MEQYNKDKILAPRVFYTRDNVLGWFAELLEAGVNFHPEDSGADLIDIGTSEPTFTEDEAKRYDALMKAATVACGLDGGEDVCALACDAWEAWATENGLLSNGTLPTASELDQLAKEIARLRDRYTIAEILRSLAAHETPGVSDEARSNGPSQQERAQSHLAERLIELAEDYE